MDGLEVRGLPQKHFILCTQCLKRFNELPTLTNPKAFCDCLVTCLLSKNQEQWPRRTHLPALTQPGGAEKVATAPDFSYTPLDSRVHFTCPVSVGAGSFDLCSDSLVVLHQALQKRDGVRHQVGKIGYKCSGESD